MDDIIARDLGMARDPERRWLRHSYQEGPGFRFLATRGGRPPTAADPRSTLEVVRTSARLLRVMRDDGLVAALDFEQCSRRSLFRWQAAYARGGLAALVPERRGPQVPQCIHPAWLEQVVIAVRLHTYWNAKRIAAELRRREIATVSHCWIERLCDDLGTSRPSGPREHGPRYERLEPEFALAHRHQGAVLHPAQPRGDTQERGPRPRVFRSLTDAEAALARFARYYNYHRLHGEIGWLTPGERYDGTPFTDRGFDHIPALAHLVPWLDELRKAA